MMPTPHPAGRSGHPAGRSGFDREASAPVSNGEGRGQVVEAATVRKIARLARLAVSEEEVVRLATEMTSILGFVWQLASLDTSAVDPLAHPLDMTNVFRPDDVRPSLDRSLALAGAPKHDGECFLVPAVLGED